MKCQVFIDCVSLFVLSILLVIAGAVYGNFGDNFLPGFYVFKLIYLAFVSVYLVPHLAKNGMNLWHIRSLSGQDLSDVWQLEEH